MEQDDVIQTSIIRSPTLVLAKGNVGGRTYSWLSKKLLSLENYTVQIIF